MSDFYVFWIQHFARPEATADTLSRYKTRGRRRLQERKRARKASR